MRPLLVILVLLSPSALADSAMRETFPADYKPSPCADPAKVCQSFNQSQMAGIAALRGFDIGQEWVDAHWKELTEAIQPSCAKVASCFAAPNSEFTFCNDILRDEVYRVCNRYPEGSTDRTKCDFYIRTFWAGHDRKSKQAWKDAQECGAGQASASAAERTFEHWIVPARIGASYQGSFVIYAIDSETRVPVRARLHIDSKERIYAEGPADGHPTTFFPVPWKPKLVRVPNAAGHRDVLPPEVRIDAPGYKSVTLRLPVEIPTMIVKMSPPPAELKPGKNTVTIVASDAATGEPVEARVMAGGYAVLGKTNEPFELEIIRGKKRPEIWVTSLYDRYSDVVVVPGRK